jgi:hypothetical protein
LRSPKNTIVLTSRILISQWPNISRVLAKLMMQSDILFKVRHIELRFPECSVHSVFMIDYNHWCKLKKSLSYTEVGSILRGLRNYLGSTWILQTCK